ncbi:DNA polymerase III subunit beta [Candidatus Gillettellia adelgis]
MKFIVKREQLLKPLQQVNNLLSSRPSLPILGNLLLRITKSYLVLIGSNLEIEIMVRVALLHVYEVGSTTIPARKFFDICRSLPETAEIIVTLKNTNILLSSGRSRFALSILPVADFPNVEDWISQIEFTLPQITLKRLIEATQFSMAHQDVRYYLNGMLFENIDKELRAIATDGHRLAVCSLPIGQQLPSYPVIIPRKGVVELMRLLDNSDAQLKLQIGTNNIRAHIGEVIFTCKLLDGHFPDYRRVLPTSSYDILETSRDLLKKAFSRVAILSNEKCRGVRLYVSYNQLKITANNAEKEEAEEILDAKYNGSEIEIGLNVNYVLDVLSVLKCKNVHLLITHSASSVQIVDSSNQTTTYIIMPMRL